MRSAHLKRAGQKMLYPRSQAPAWERQSRRLQPPLCMAGDMSRSIPRLEPGNETRKTLENSIDSTEFTAQDGFSQSVTHRFHAITWMYFVVGLIKNEHVVSFFQDSPAKPTILIFSTHLFHMLLYGKIHL